MPKNFRRVLVGLLTVTTFVVQFPFSSVSAEITSCGSTVTPHQVDPGSTNNFVINVSNTDSEDIVWIEIAKPSDKFTLGNIIASGWSVTNTGASFILENGSLAGGASRNFFLTGTVVANTNAPSENWRVTVSDDVGVANPFDCTGSLGTQIGEPDTTAPVISNISVSSIGSSGAVISWTTNELANSTVNYGLTAGYGSNSSSGTFKTSHSQTLTGLTAGSTYHFRVVSTDQSSNTATSADNTFITSATSSGSSSTPKPTSTIQPNSSDQNLPTLTLKTNLNQIFPISPEIEGTATDNVGVSKIDYSLDNGTNFISITATGLNSTESSFKFTPTISQEGNYSLVFRVTDVSGNILISETYTLVIDRDAPTFGPSLVTVGPQVLSPKLGQIQTTVSQEHKIYLPIKGGAIAATIKANSKDPVTEKIFNLTFSADSGLWVGALSFEKEGSYELLVEAIDGAGKKGSKALATFKVEKPLQMTDEETGKPIKDIKVEIFNYQKELGIWGLWQAESFSSQNPQTSSADGLVTSFLPAGRYYLKLTSPDYQTSVSQIIEVDKSQALVGEIKLKKALKLGLGDFSVRVPSLVYQNFNLETKTSETETSPQSSQQLPQLDLTSTNNQKLALAAKATAVCFLNTWSPTTSEQIQALTDLQKSNNYNIVPVFSLESKEKINSYLRVGDYDLTSYLDPAGLVLTQLKVTDTGTCQFYDSTGKLKSTKSEVLTAEELEYNLNN